MKKEGMKANILVLTAKELIFVKTIHLKDAIFKYINTLADQAEKDEDIDKFETFKDRLKVSYKEYFQEGFSSLNFAINDNLDVIIQISCLHEQELFTELNQNFRPKDLPIL